MCHGTQPAVRSPGRHPVPRQSRSRRPGAALPGIGRRPEPYARMPGTIRTMARGARRMSRLGTWKPTTIEERLDRMESLAEIRQLPHRYGVAIDSRDMDMMVELFVPHVRVGKEEF